MDINSLAGAFGSVVEPAATVAARNAASQQLGAWGLPAQLSPFAPAPATPIIGNVGASANLAAEDKQAPTMSFWAKNKKLLMIGGALVLVLVLFVFKRKKK